MIIKNTQDLNNGLSIPRLGLGVFRSPAGEITRNAVRTALECGYRHIDTARAYCNEKSVGRGIRDSGVAREDIFITTKLWKDDFSDPRRGLIESLKRLNTDYVDLYLLHWPFTGYVEAYKVLEQLQQEGLCRSIGVSNFKIHHLQTLFDSGIKVIPQVNQFECHPENSETELIAFCRKHQIVPEAYSPLGGAGTSLADDPRLLGIAQYYKVSIAQVLLRWNIQRGVVVIPKSVHKERIELNSKIFDFELNSDDMDAVSALNADLRRGYDPDKINERPQSQCPQIHEEE